MDGPLIMTAEEQARITQAERTWRNFKAFANAVEILLALGAVIFFAVFITSQFDNDPPVRFVGSDKHVDTTEDGRAFFVTRETCMDRDIPAISLARLVGVNNSLLIPLPQKTLAASKGCRTYSVFVPVPDEAPPGEYEYRITFRFTMNPFKTLDVEAQPVRVTVKR